MNPNLERARAEAARAFHSTLLSEGVIIQTNALDAALGAFLAAARADEGLVERVAKALAAHWSARVKEPDWPGDLYKHEFDGLARAAIAAMWDMAPEVSNDAG